MTAVNKLNKYKLVIFDMDGTLADTSQGIVNSVRYVQRKMNLPEITLEQMYFHVGPPMEESYNRNFGLTGAALRQAVELHKEYAIENGYKELRWYDNIPELLNTLRANGVVTAIATLKAQKTIQKILDYYNMSDKFDIVIGTNSETPMDKHQLLDCCLEKANITAELAVLVGDSIYDAVGAEKAGIDFIAVTYGFGFKQREDVGAHRCVAVCENIKDIGVLVYAPKQYL